MSHGKDEPQPELKRYCHILGLSTTHDPTNPEFISKVSERLPVLKEKAQKIIDRKISKENNNS
jgi:hypothetical protein